MSWNELNLTWHYVEKWAEQKPEADGRQQAELVDGKDERQDAGHVHCLLTAYASV